MSYHGETPRFRSGCKVRDNRGKVYVVVALVDRCPNTYRLQLLAGHGSVGDCYVMSEEEIEPLL